MPFVNIEQYNDIMIFLVWWVASLPCGAVLEDELNVAFQGALSEI